jgi:tetratricopeptide (TPR) repeat protein
MIAIAILPRGDYFRVSFSSRHSFSGAPMLPIFPACWRNVVASALAVIASSTLLSAQEPAALQAQAKQCVENRQLPEAEKLYLGAIKGYEAQLAGKTPPDGLILRWCQCRDELAEVQMQLLKIADARALFASTSAYLQRVIPLRPKEVEFRFQLAKSQVSLSKSYRHIHLYPESAEQVRGALELARKLIQDRPNRADYRLAQSEWLTAHASLLTELARFRDAESAYQEATRESQKLVNDFPKAPEYAFRLAVVHNAHALLVRESGQYPESIDLIREAIRLLVKLEAEHPEQPKYWFPLPHFYRNVAQPLGYANNDAEVKTAKREAARVEAKLAKMPDAARKWSRDSDKILGSLHGQDLDRLAEQQKEMDNLLKEAGKETEAGASPYIQARLASVKGVHALQLTARGLRDDACKEFVQAIELLDKVNAKEPGIPLNRFAQADLQINYGLTFLLYGQVAEGKKILDAGISVMEKLADDYPQSPHLRFGVAEALVRISMVTESTNEWNESAHYFAAAQEVLRKLAEEYPACPKYRRHHAGGLVTLAKKLYQAKQDEAAEKALREALRVWPRVVADFPAIAEFRDQMGSAHGTFGQLLFKREKYPEAEAAFKEMLRIHQKLLADFPHRADYQTSLAFSWSWVGQLRDKQNRPAEAVESYGNAVAFLDQAVKLNPRRRAWLASLRSAVQARSFAYLKLGNAAEYQRDLDRLKDLDEALDSPRFRLLRLDDRARKGETERALHEADDLFQNVDLTENQWHELAVFYASMSTKMPEAEARETMAARGVASLGNAVEQGYSRDNLSQESGFGPLIQREDFRRLLTAK